MRDTKQPTPDTKSPTLRDRYFFRLCVLSLGVWCAWVSCVPLPPSHEHLQESLHEAGIEYTVADSTDEKYKSDDTTKEPDAAPDSRDERPGDGEHPRPEPTIDAPAEQPPESTEALHPDKDAGPDTGEGFPEPTPPDGAPDGAPETANPTEDAIERSEPPDVWVEPIPEGQTESTPESSADAPPACAPHIPPATAPNEWAVSDGEGASFLFVRDMKVDQSGFVYVCGEFSGSQATFHGKIITNGSGSSQMFVLKFDAAGKSLWVTTLPGTGHRSCRGLALGTGGAIYITGEFGGSITQGTTTLTAQSLDLFVARLNTCGDVVWVVKGGGQSADSGHYIALDNKDQIYVYGQFNGPASFGTHQITTQDTASVFVARLDPQQGSFGWVATGGAAQAPDTPSGLGVTPLGDVYISGSSFLPVTFGPFQLNSQHPFELFIAKLNPQGTFVWAKQTAGTGRIVPYRSGIDAAGRFYVTGELDGSKQFGTMSLTSPAHGDIFLLQIDSQGIFQWVLRPTGTSHLHPYGLVISVGGYFLAGDFTGDPDFGGTKLSSTFLRSFVARATTTPSFNWAISTKGTDAVRAQAIAIGPKGDLFVAGNFQGSGTFGTITLQKQPFTYHMFLWKIPKP